MLLKSAPADPKGFVAKIADFGLALSLAPTDTHVSGAFQGTVTHMVRPAREGHKKTRAREGRLSRWG